MDPVPGKFCPVCKRKNESGAMVCVYCGSPLDYSQESSFTTLRVNRKGEETNILPELTEKAFQKSFKSPEDGIAIYVKGYVAPVEIRTEREFTLGRLPAGDIEEAFVDLSPFGGYKNGVSRRHALIRRTRRGYEILDQGSTNGTWLNQKRLTSDKPYPLDNGAQVGLGRLQIFVIYREMADES